MPLKIAPEDRKLAVIFGIVRALALLLSVYTIQTDRGAGGVPSSYSSGDSGAKAAFLLLQNTGYSPRRWSDDPRKLASLPPGATLILADPFPADEPDLQAVREFVSKGGRVVATGVGAAFFFPQKRFSPGMPHFQWKSYKPQEPSDLTRGIDEIKLAPQYYFDSAKGEIPFADGDERPVTRFSYGAGEVIWWSTSDPLTNAGIRESDNAQLLLNSVGDPGRGPVLWDEYFHQGSKTVLDSVIDSPIRWALVQAALIGVIVCFTFSRRFGPVRQSVAASRLAPMEYVETLAALYSRTGAAHVTVEIVYERFRAALQRRYSVRTDAPVSQVAATIVNHLGGADFAAVTDTIQQIEDSVSDPSFPAVRATELIRQMHEWSARLK